MSLLELIKEKQTVYYPSDKLSLGYYNEFYDKLFSPRKYIVKNLLEIGVSNGNSIRTWRDYFVNAQIYGLDINDCSFEDTNRIKFEKSNAYTFEVLNSFENNFFDIIIDDGPHTFESQEFFLINYFQKVKSGGFLIVEDIVCGECTEKLLSLVDKNLANVQHIDMRKKQLTHLDPLLEERWSNNRLDVIIVEKY